MKILLTSFSTMILIILITLPLETSANSGTGSELYKNCMSGDFRDFKSAMLDNFETDIAGGIESITGFAHCYGVITAVADISEYICRPDDVINSQLVLIVRKWLSDNPKEHHYSAASLAEFALIEAFPCSPEEINPDN